MSSAINAQTNNYSNQSGLERTETLKKDLAGIQPSKPKIDHIWYRPFVATNEYGKDETFGKLSKHPTVGNAAIGVSGFCLLDMCAQTKGVEHIFLVDIGKRVADFWGKMQPIICESSDRHEVLKKTADLLRSNAKTYYTGSNSFSPDSLAHGMIQDLYNEIGAGKSWLSSDDNFEKIQEIFQKNRFHFLPYDLTDTQAFEALGKVCHENGIVFRLCYISNVYEYLDNANQRDAFAQSLDQVIAPKTVVINTRNRQARLTQFVQRTNGRPARELFLPAQPPKPPIPAVPIIIPRSTVIQIPELAAMFAKQASLCY